VQQPKFEGKKRKRKTSRILFSCAHDKHAFMWGDFNARQEGPMHFEQQLCENRNLAKEMHQDETKRRLDEHSVNLSFVPVASLIHRSAQLDHKK